MTSTTFDRAPTSPSAFWLVVSLVVVGSAVPLVLYGALFGPIRTVTPSQARKLLDQSGEATMLVDVRPADVFASGHIDGAVNWPLERVWAVKAAEDVPPQLQNRTLLLICDVGLASRLAAWRLARQGVDGATNVRGGIQEWFHSITMADDQGFATWTPGPLSTSTFEPRKSPPLEQALAVIAYFMIKPTYTLLAFLLAMLLWRSRSPDLVALRWGLIFFFLGENACGANYAFFKEQSYFLEYLHSLGMLLCLGFVAYAGLEGFDRRILRLTDPKQHCAALGLCGACIKYADVPCGLKRTFYLILPVGIVLCLMLPLADWQDTTYGTTIFRTFYCYGHLRIFQLFENWFCSAAAITLFSLSLATLVLSKGHDLSAAKITFAAGLGPLGFGMLRVFLGAAYDQNRVWYLFWEEGTEFLFILGIGIVLWIFRRGLLPDLNLPEELTRLLTPSPRTTRQETPPAY